MRQADERQQLLIRLLDRDLAEEEGEKLLAKLAENPPQLEQAKQLQALLRAADGVGKRRLWRELELVDVEEVAEVLDGGALELDRLSLRQIDELSTLTSSHRPTGGAAVLDELPAPLGHALERALSQQLAGGVAHEPPNDAPVRVSVSTAPTNVDQRSQGLARTGRSATRSATLVYWSFASVITVALLLAGIVLLSHLRNTRSPILSQEGDDMRQLPAPHNSIAPASESLPRNNDEGPALVDIPLPLPDLSPRDEDLQPSNDPQLQPRPEPGRPAKPIPLKWERISGAIAVREIASESWQPLFLEGSQTQRLAGSRVAYRTLGSSWARASTESGSYVVLGENSSAEVEITQGERWQGTVQLLHGKVGLGLALAARSLLRVESADGAAENWTIEEAGTIVALLCDGDELRTRVLQGAVNDGQTTHRAPIEIVSSMGSLASGPVTEKSSWMSRPPSLTPLERQLAELAKEETDLVTGLLADKAGLTDVQAQAAAQWSFSIDAPRSIPLALDSRRPAHRTAAVLWLLEPLRTPEEMRAVFAQLRAPLANSKCSVPRWIAVARGDAALSRSLVENLLQGLSSTEPLFVREMAIQFLRQATGQRLATYDPARPTRQAIMQVRSVVRRWLNALPEARPR